MMTYFTLVLSYLWIRYGIFHHGCNLLCTGNKLNQNILTPFDTYKKYVSVTHRIMNNLKKFKTLDQAK